MSSNFNNKGYTIIELLIVITVLVVITSFGFAGYNNFNQSQTLDQAAISVENALRDAQNRTITGVKDCTQCQIGAVCGDSDDRALEYWQVVPTLNGQTYTISGKCVSNATTFGTINASLPTLMQFTNPAQTVRFMPVLQRSATASTIRIRHSGFTSNNCINITVSVTGQISRGNPFTC